MNRKCNAIYTSFNATREQSKPLRLGQISQISSLELNKTIHDVTIQPIRRHSSKQLCNL